MIETNELREPTDLKKTVLPMLSSNYKCRFVGEYLQVKIRLEKLKTLVAKWDAGTLKFLPKCPREVFDRQVRVMEGYLSILEERAVIEGVDVTKVQSENDMLESVDNCVGELVVSMYAVAPGRNVSLTITKLQEAQMWNERELKTRGNDILH